MFVYHKALLLNIEWDSMLLNSCFVLWLYFRNRIIHHEVCV